MEQNRRRAKKGLRLSLPDRYYERGLDYYTKGKLDLALADLDEAISSNPKRAEYYAARGLLLLQQGFADDAEDDFALALKLDPAQWLAHYGRGMRAYQDKDYAGAITSFSRAQRIAPQRFEIYYHRAVAFHAAGQPEEAVRDMQFALTLLEGRDKRRAQASEWLAIFEKALPASPRRSAE